MLPDERGTYRYVSANHKARFKNLSDFLREMAWKLGSHCECDGRGCTDCIAADAMREAAIELEKHQGA